VARGDFRRDLYARLAGWVIRLPPLRERRADLAALLRLFLARLAPHRRLDLSATFMERVALHDWPMNVRELRAFVARALVEAGSDLLDLATAEAALQKEPAPPRPSAPAPAPIGEPDREQLAALLTEARGNVELVADRLGRHRQQVYRWMKRHGLEVERFRR